MAKPIQSIQRTSETEEQKRLKALENLLSEVAANEDSLLETLMLLQELHDSGILEALNSFLKVKDRIAKIAVEQVSREPVTNLLNNTMALGGVLTDLDPETTTKLGRSVTAGMQKAEQGLKVDTTMGLVDLIKALKDPDINRAIGFGYHFLKGMGEGLKKEC